MAKKSNIGNAYHNYKRKEERLVEKIDQRDKSGRNMENVDSAYNNYRYAPNGEKVWSF